MELRNTFSKFRYISIGVLAATALLCGYAFSQKAQATSHAASSHVPHH